MSRIRRHDVPERAAVLGWLVEHGVVGAMPTNSGLGQLAHPPGAAVLNLSNRSEQRDDSRGPQSRLGL